MLLLVFFLSHVDESRDKVLKLAPLRQLLSKVNQNLLAEHRRVFILIAVSGYGSVWDTHMRVCRARTCTHAHGCLSENIKYHRKLHSNCFLYGVSAWIRPVKGGPPRPQWPLSYRVTWIPGYCLPNTAAALLFAYACSRFWALIDSFTCLWMHL